MFSLILTRTETCKQSQPTLRLLGGYSAHINYYIAYNPSATTLPKRSAPLAKLAKFKLHLNHSLITTLTKLTH